MGVEWLNREEFLRGSARFREEFPGAAMQVMRQGAELALFHAKERAPVRTGALRESFQIIEENEAMRYVTFGSLLRYAYWVEVDTSRTKGHWMLTQGVEDAVREMPELMSFQIGRLRWGRA